MRQPQADMSQGIANEVGFSLLSFIIISNLQPKTFKIRACLHGDSMPHKLIIDTLKKMTVNPQNSLFLSHPQNKHPQSENICQISA